MSAHKPLIKQMIGLAVACVACFVPNPWVYLPALAFLLFWVPGRAIVHLLRPLRAQPGWAWCSLAISITVVPVLLHWVWQISNHRGLILGALLAFDVVLVMAANVWGAAAVPTSSIFEGKWQRRLFAAMVAWSACWVFLFYWIPQAGGRLVPSPAGDYVKHHALLWSLERYPLPLHNVFYAAESSTPYYYYEQAHLLPATLRIISRGQLSQEFCFGAVGACVAASFLGMVLLVARNFLRSGWAALLATLCASLAGGWDIVPCSLIFMTSGQPTIFLDSWSEVAWRVHNLMSGMIWFPQHMAALTAVILCCYWLQVGARRGWWMVMGPVAAASILGSSIYMALFAFAAATVYVLVDLRREVRVKWSRARGLLTGVLVMAVLGAMLMVPTVLQYREMGQRFGGGATTRWERYPYALLGRLAEPGVLANWLDALWLVPVEFGLMGLAWLLVLPVVWRRLWLDAGTRLLVIAGAIGLITLWTVRSDINRYDYAYRMGSLFSFLVGALCVGALLKPELMRPVFRRWHRPILIGGIVLGLPVGLYEPSMAAMRTLFEKPPELAEREAIRFVRQTTPYDAVIQPEPTYRANLVQLFDRQVGVLMPDSHVNVFRPRDADKMLRAVSEINFAFATDDPAHAHDLFSRWGVTHVFVGGRERKMFGKMDHFAERQWFNNVYDDGRAAVYELKR